MLQQLPHEILLAIWSSLETRLDQLNLARCSMFLYTAFRPDLFSHVSLRITNSIHADGFWPLPPQGLPVVKFAQAVLHNPQLGVLVHSLNIFADPSETGAVEVDALLPASYEEVVQSVSSSETFSRRWMGDLEAGSEDAWLALLLTRLRDLKCLSIDLPELLYCQYLTHIIQDAASQCTPNLYLTRLAQVEIREAETWENPHHFNLTRLPPFFQIPSMRTIRTFSVAPGPLELNGDSGVTAIQFVHTKIPMKDLSGLITQCPHLEDFQYTSIDQTGYHDPSTRSDIFNPTPLHASLYGVKDTLRNLSLAISDYLHDTLWQTIEYPTRRFFGSLSDFPVLQNLQVRLTNLIEFQSGSWEPVSSLVDILPLSLRSLYIEDFYTEALATMLEHLSDVASQCPGRFTQLRKVMIRPPGQEGPPNDIYYRRKSYMAREYHILPVIRELEASFVPKLSMLKDRFHEVGVVFQAINRYERVSFP